MQLSTFCTWILVFGYVLHMDSRIRVYGNQIQNFDHGVNLYGLPSTTQTRTVRSSFWKWRSWHWLIRSIFIRKDFKRNIFSKIPRAQSGSISKLQRSRSESTLAALQWQVHFGHICEHSPKLCLLSMAYDSWQLSSSSLAEYKTSLPGERIMHWNELFEKLSHPDMLLGKYDNLILMVLAVY